MFKFALIALLPILAVAAQTAQPGHLARQTPSAADCTTPCTALSDSVSAAGGSTGGLAALCTDTITTNYANCYGCQVKSAGLAQKDAQQAIDAYAQGCKAGGHPVNSVTIGADGSTTGGSTGGSAPAGSGSGSTPAPPSGKTGAGVRTTAGLMGTTSALVMLALAGW